MCGSDKFHSIMSTILILWHVYAIVYFVGINSQIIFDSLFPHVANSGD